MRKLRSPEVKSFLNLTGEKVAEPMFKDSLSSSEMPTWVTNSLVHSAQGWVCRNCQVNVLQVDGLLHKEGKQPLLAGFKASLPLFQPLTLLPYLIPNAVPMKSVHFSTLREVHWNVSMSTQAQSAPGGKEHSRKLSDLFRMEFLTQQLLAFRAIILSWGRGGVLSCAMKDV